MADRYWVLGTGTWDATSTTNWSASSGGAGGASVPTASDNVFFDANSNILATAFTVTMANTPRVCNDFTASGLDGTMTLAGTSIGLTVSGNLTFQATNFTRTYTGGTTFNATTTGKTVTTNGVAFGGSVVFNGVGGGWTLGSALTTGGSFTFTVNQGTFNSANYAITCGIFSSNSTSTRTLNLGSSTITFGVAVSGAIFNIANNAGLTFNAGTSTFTTAQSGSVNFAGGGVTFYNVSFTSASSNGNTITGANTFRDLTFTGRISPGITPVTFSADQTINGTLTLGAGTSAAYRTFLRSDTIGTPRTLTCAAISSVTDVDFKDINFAGAISLPVTGTRLGDCKGNSGISFDAAKTVYYARTGAGSWGTTGTGSWSATSGGALDATMFPLAQDTAVFPAATYPSSGSTSTVASSYNIGTIDMSLRTSNTMTLATGSTTPQIYGNWINGTGTTLSGSGVMTFAGCGSQTITSAGRTFTQGFNINTPSNSVTLQDAFTTAATSTTTLTQGTLDLQSYTFSTGLFNSAFSSTRTIAFGTGNITCTGTGTVWNTATATNLTTTGTQVVNVTSTGSTAITVASGFLSEANSISYNFTGGTYALTFLETVSHTVRNVDFTGYAGTWGVTNTTTIYGNLKISTGITLTTSANILSFRGTSGTQQITTNAKTIDFPLTFNGVGGTFRLEDALTMGSTRAATLTNGTLDLNGKTLTVGTRFTTATGTKNLTFNGGTLVCPDANPTSFNNAVPTGFTTTAGTGTGTISMTAATAKTFVGGGSTYNCTLNQGGAGALTITGSNTFGNITNTVQPATVLFTAGTTSTFSNFSLSGTAGNLITIGSVTAASHTLSKTLGVVAVSYCSISRSTATGGATWNALNSTNGGNNSGWNFLGSGYIVVANNGTYSVTGQATTILRSKRVSGDYGAYTLTGQIAELLRSKALSGDYGSYAVTGQDATLRRSKVLSGDYGAYVVVGQDATFQKSKVLLGDYGAYAVAGQDALLLRSKVLSGDYGAYAVTGQNATLQRSKVLLSDYGSYSVTGQNAAIQRSRALSGDYGSYSVTGQTASLLRSKVLLSDYGSYAVTGQNASLLRSKVLSGGSGAYALTGQTASLLRSKALSGDFGSYAVAGQTASLLRTRVLLGNFGAYTITGVNASIQKGKVLLGEFGSYTTVGVDASIQRTRLFDANTGQYALSGQDAIITIGGTPVVVDEQLLIKLRSFTERRRF